MAVVSFRFFVFDVRQTRHILADSANMPRTPLAAKENSLLTAEQLSAISDLPPCELERGKIKLASPTYFDHGRYEANFCYLIRSFVEPRNLGKVAVGEVGVITERGPDTVRGADLVFISRERLARVESESAYLSTAPDLVVEIKSRSNTAAKLKRKLDEYFALGVRLVWLAFPGKRIVRAYRSRTDFREYGEAEDLPGEDVLPGFSEPVSRFFA